MGDTGATSLVAVVTLLRLVGNVGACEGTCEVLPAAPAVSCPGGGSEAAGSGRDAFCVLSCARAGPEVLLLLLVNVAPSIHDLRVAPRNL